jgi:phytoene dehydrogenase-like protein
MSAQKVIVVGGGLSGLSAAHTLYERGANVFILDKVIITGLVAASANTDLRTVSWVVGSSARVLPIAFLTGAFRQLDRGNVGHQRRWYRGAEGSQHQGLEQALLC